MAKSRAQTRKIQRRGYRQENPYVRRLLIFLSLAFTLLFLVTPLVCVVYQALGAGWDRFLGAITNIYTVKALYLTFLTSIFAVVFNTLFGLAAAWALTRFAFRGQNLIITLIDLPFAISPIIAGLVFILTFGRLGWAKPLLDYFQVKIVFATPGLVLATIFVTLPFVAREIIPVLLARGTDEEQAAVMMGAGFFRVFFKITLPHIRWALI
ncbi:MAG: sulfate ABC transporter permease, partial [Deltaproteobacteria bacterium]|nr:sulfate ABC transporter permease [Deltaproteobacteria bacterium]